MIAKGPTSMKLAALTSFLAFFALSSCVSVSIANHEAKHASDVKVQEPAPPFTAEKRNDVDAAWKDSRNGNLISFLSDCQDDTDPGLDTIVQGALAGLNDLHIESMHSPTIQGREARRAVATGKVDGVPSKIDLLVFKRNRCIFILTYVGVAQSFAENHSQFDHFVDGFHAP